MTRISFRLVAYMGVVYVASVGDSVGAPERRDEETSICEDLVRWRVGRSCYGFCTSGWRSFAHVRDMNIPIFHPSLRGDLAMEFSFENNKDSKAVFRELYSTPLECRVGRMFPRPMAYDTRRSRFQ